MSFSCFEIDTKDGVSHLKLNRPATLNSMVREFWTELPSAIEELDASGTTRVIVLSSTGAHFSSGMDLSVFESGVIKTAAAHDRDQIRRLILLLQHAFNVLEECRVPTIAAVHGGCIGGAFDMVCACDIRLATRDAFFKIQEINLAMMADLGVLQRLPHLVPQGVVRELAYTGDPLAADRAHSLGLVNSVFDTHELMIDAAMVLAKKIAQQSPLAVSASKAALNFARDHGVAESLKQCADLQASVLSTDELMECMKARKEKRNPTFADLRPVKDKI